ncbi:MAG: HIT family protein [Candidatus Coprenecus sp.]|nr:HIT family protein [Candidatus Coprenecus sp.]
MDSIFTKIVKGEIPSYKVAENETCYAFLDINPLAKGHTLVIPKKQVDYLFDLDEELYVELQLFAKKVAKALGKAIPSIRIAEAVIGLDVPHAHIHLIPINSELDVDFKKERVKLTPEEFVQIAESIRREFSL